MIDQVAAQGASQPLLGWRILTTRASRQSGGLAAPLRELGAEVVEVPTIAIHPPSTYEPLDSALRKIKDYDWLLLTSVNAVEAIVARLNSLGMNATDLKHLQIAAIGPATKKAIEAQQLSVSVTPEKYVAESVVEALRGKTEGKRVLLARAKVARDILPSELKKARVLLDVVEAYETKVPAGAQEKLQKLFSSHSQRPDIITFTSSSTATNFLSLLGNGNDQQQALKDVALASIGPVTSHTLREAGFPPPIEAREYTMQGLVLAITEYVHKRAAQQLLERLGLKS
ncbi:MAG TPA: uroporphyrinogen-III synthase [Candidatus Angelobacter sp.]|nr:uroporphyrinogen-III synthase [Candidatus Angelobacter sp.]